LLFYRYKNQGRTRREKRGGHWTADERSRAIFWYGGDGNPCVKTSAETEFRQRQDFRGTGSTRLLLVGAHCFGKDVVYVLVATPQCRVLCPARVLLCPLATASYAKDTGLIILY
jgi:hypothetical protein